MERDISLCIRTTNIAKAYDHVTFELVEKDLTKKGGYEYGRKGNPLCA